MNNSIDRFSLEKLVELNAWSDISNREQPLSEEFIENNKGNLYWSEILENQCLSEAFIEKMFDYIDWYSVSEYQILSEAFIEKYQDKLNWRYISVYQKLSEDFIRKFKNKVSWFQISKTQTLSESFIEEHSMYVHWDKISRYQSLSEGFIERFKDKLNLDYIAASQPISLKFRTKFFNPCQLMIQKKSHAKKSLATKREEMAKYAEKWNLKFDGKFLYAFRNHDKFGRGDFNQTKRYEKGKTYRDWRCDMDESNGCSFGLGIWPKGNTPVKVALKNWGCAVDHDGETLKKGRVFAFTVL